MANGEVIDDRVCPVCKREFIVPMGGKKSYTYKIVNRGRYKYFCTWTCYKIAKRKMLYQKNKLSVEERNWLKWADGK